MVLLKQQQPKIYPKKRSEGGPRTKNQEPRTKNQQPINQTKNSTQTK